MVEQKSMLRSFPCEMTLKRKLIPELPGAYQVMSKVEVVPLFGKIEQLCIVLSAVLLPIP